MNDDHTDNNSLIEKAVTELGEHGDFVALIIMATWCDGGETVSLFAGAGNDYAKEGLARDYIRGLDQGSLAYDIAAAVDHDDDEGDGWKE